MTNITVDTNFNVTMYNNNVFLQTITYLFHISL